MTNVIKCRVCGQHKPSSEMKRANKGKPTTICKICDAQRQKERYAVASLQPKFDNALAKLKLRAKELGVEVKILVNGEWK